MIDQNKQAKQSKFQDEDLPKILAAIAEARTANMASQVIVDVAPNGGILSVTRKSQKNYK